MKPPSLEVTLAMTPVCPHCPSMLEILSQAVKKGDIAVLHIVNIARQPDFAQRNGIRAVPWMKIGPFILSGLQSQREIHAWLERAGSEQGILDYFSEMLSGGELETVTSAIKQSPETIKSFIPLISSDETNINVRLGMAAILEELAGQAILENLLAGLLELLGHANARVRGDAAHFLSFINSPAAVEALRKCLTDPEADVREIAEESLQALSVMQ